jgi:hypothetical protein
LGYLDLKVKANLRFFGVLLASAVVLAPLDPARAQSGHSRPQTQKAHPRTQEEIAAEGRFNRGIQLYRDGDYAPALVEFRRAYELSQNYRVLYNIGQVSYQLKDYAGALRAFEGYLSGGEKQIPADRRAEVTKEVERLRLRVGTLKIKIDQPDVEILIDDVSVGKTPLAAPVLVSAGHRKLVASKGRNAVTKIIEVGGGEAIEVPIELNVEQQAQPSEVPTGREQVQSPKPRTYVATKSSNLWIFGAATGALAGGAALTGTFALLASSSLDDERGTLGSTKESRESTASRAKTLAIVTDVLWGATAVMAGVSLYITLKGGRPQQPANAATPSPLPPARTLRLVATPTSALLMGAF